MSKYIECCYTCGNLIEGEFVATAITCKHGKINCSRDCEIDNECEDCMIEDLIPKNWKERLGYK